MKVLEEAAEIVRRKWRSGDKWLKVLLALAIGVGFLLLLGYLFSRLIKLIVPARVNNQSLYFPGLRRHRMFK